MATSYTNTPIDHTSDAGFRAWGKELSDSLAAIGCAQTADTGQINWSTVTRAGANSDAGYEMWAMNDTLHSSAPVFFKIYYGTGGATDRPRLRIEVGTATNGSGGFVGTAMGPFILNANTTPSSTTTNCESYSCMTEGFVGSCTKIGFSGSGNYGAFSFFALARPCNLDGTLRSDAITLAYTDAGTSYLYERTLHFSTGNMYGDTSKSYCFVPNGITTSSIGTEFAAFKHYTAYPKIYPLNGLCSTLLPELGLGSTADCALNGTTEHTYVCLGSSAYPFGITYASKNEGNPNTALCMLWE